MLMIYIETNLYFNVTSKAITFDTNKLSTSQESSRPLYRNCGDGKVNEPIVVTNLLIFNYRPFPVLILFQILLFQLYLRELLNNLAKPLLLLLCHVWHCFHEIWKKSPHRINKNLYFHKT